MDEMPQYDDRADKAAALQLRIGERYAISIPVKFALQATRRFQRTPKAFEAITRDWSYTGLSFVSDEHKDLVERTMILITVGPVTGAAVIKSVRPVDEPNKVHYGIEFRSQALEDVARELVDIHLGRVPEDRPIREATPGVSGPQQPDMGDWY